MSISANNDLTFRDSTFNMKIDIGKASVYGLSSENLQLSTNIKNNLTRLNLNWNSSDSSQTPITDLPVTLPPNQNVMEAQKQMLHFNQALQNNALQNIVNRDEMMNPPLDNSVHPMPSGF